MSHDTFDQKLRAELRARGYDQHEATRAKCGRRRYSKRLSWRGLARFLSARLTAEFGTPPNVEYRTHADGSHTVVVWYTTMHACVVRGRSKHDALARAILELVPSSR